MDAIQTFYRGYKFRSRLEARWAVFLDALSITWEYEKEGYKLSNGVWYLPDFWLPTFSGGMFVEVKGEFTPEEIKKCEQLCKDSGKPVWMAEGVPNFRTYDVFFNEGKEVHTMDCSPNADQARFDNRMYVSCEFANPDGTISKDNWHWLAGNYENAVYAARSARFEHGETPG